MHIAVDGSFWGGEERGVAVATRRLWSAFLARSASVRVSLFAPASCRSQMPHASLTSVGPLRGAARIAWQQFALPGLVRDQGADLLHCPCYTAPLNASCRLVITVHDLIAWTHPGLAGWRNALHLRLLLGHGVRRAAVVCVPTQFVRRSVIDRFHISPDKVFVVPWGVDAEISPISADAAACEVRRRFGVDQPFILFCGCVEPKKNLPLAIRAAAEAGFLLLIVGPWSSRSRRVLAEAGVAADGCWRYLGYVSVADLSALYSAATALVFPSHAEGFGLPAIEAMRCGCPVIASNAPALTEVCGGAAIHVRDRDPGSLSRSVRAVVADRGLREDLAARGVARAARFSWVAAAERFGEALSYAAR